MKLYPYNEGSESAKALAKALGIKRLKREGKHLNVDVVLNWGCSSDNFPRRLTCEEILNDPNFVRIATNKLKSFNTLKGHVSIPDFTESLEEANKWLAEGVMVVERHKLTGHSGEGVRIVEQGEELQRAPLYVKYIPKVNEYRLHVFRDKVFFVQRKARKEDVPNEEVNWKVRNLKGGFIYANRNIEVAEQAKQQAIIALQILGLDFGAVDIIYNKRHNKYYVLEVNTACGLSGTTLEKYVEIFKEFV